MADPDRLISIETINRFSFTHEEDIRCRTERPIKDYDNLPTIPLDNPVFAMSALREHIVGERLSGSMSQQWLDLANNHLAGYITERPATIFHNLEPEQATSSWQLLFRAMKWTRLRHLASANSQFIYDLADEYYREFPLISRLGYAEGHLAFIAIRHTCARIEKYIREYGALTDMTEYRAKKLVIMHDINYPEHAALDYLLRLRFLREHLEEPVPSVIVRMISFKASNLHACGRLLQQWYAKYVALTESPTFRGYEDWLLQQAALLSPQYHRQILSRWNHFFRVVTRTVSLNSKGFGGREYNDLIADPEAMLHPDKNPEAYALLQESRREIMNHLLTLPEIEQDAVAVVFGIEHLLDRDPPDATILAQRLGVTDLASYVHQTLLPKLRPRTVSTDSENPED